MSIGILNTTKALTVVGTFAGVSLAVWGIWTGIGAAIHGYHLSYVHQGHNITYVLKDCQAVPGGSGSQWEATILVHNGNPNTTDDYGVQVEFMQGVTPVAWTSVQDIGSMDSGDSKTLHLEVSVNDSGSASGMTCKAVFYRNGSAAGDTSPVPAG